MKVTRYIRTPLLLFLLFLLFGIVAENYVLSGGIRQGDIKRFTNTLHRKLTNNDQLKDEVATELNKIEDESIAQVFDALKMCNELFEHKEQSIIVTRNDELIYWSDHVVGFYNEVMTLQEGLVELPNGWFVLTRLRQNDYIIHGLTLIKYNYKVENEYLRNTFAKGFHLPDDFHVRFYNSETSYPIFDQQNSFLFSIEPSGLLPCIYTDLYIPVALYILTLFFMLMTFFRFSNHYHHRFKEIKLIVLLLFLLILYWLMVQTGLPKSVFLLDLFTPKYFAYSSLWKSMGEFLLFTVLLFFWSVVFARSFDISNSLKSTKSTLTISLNVWLLQLAAFFIIIRFMIYTLMMNSSVSYSIYRIEDLSVFSFIGFLAIGMLYLAFFFIAFRTTQVFRKKVSYQTFFVSLTIISLVLGLALLKLSPTGNIRLSLFFWLISAACFWSNKSKVINHRLALIVLFVFIYTLFTISILVPFQERNERKIQELMAMNLSVEHDPMAELFIRDIDSQIKADTLFETLLKPPYDEAWEYLSRKYFGGYLREYELQFTVCSAGDSLMIQPENTLQPCYAFFYEMFETTGAEIQGTNFYFLDNMNGRITYLGRYGFNNNPESCNCTVFIELNSKLLSEGTGFPELLLPTHSFESRLKGNFSFAKYNNDELVDRGGDFLYALTSKSYTLPENEIGFDTWGGHEHCIYQLENGSFVVVSRKKAGLYEYLISFPYVFVFLFILSVIVNFASKPYINLSPFKSSLRLRIQVSIIGVVFITLLIVGSGTILYNIAQYRSNHRKDLIDKINSISVEIDQVMRNDSGFSDLLIQDLYYELIRISDVFWTDVNIYNLNGELVVTSRPEVFDKGLISTQMDNSAIYHLNRFEPTRFLHQEHIAKMEYLSAYMPLINRTGKNIGYINIPYFTKQREFRKEITTFILAFVNIYVFLLLMSVIVAYLIAIRITFPLKLIRENLRFIQLGKETKPIEYRSDDEIGLLVSEYNNKLEELAYSTELLARSERETAWREMAKQIAHEIKNPLTPMKLNIQFLQRIKPGEMENYDEKVKRVTETLIEQIDNLSSIATEFSNFAQMPKARNEQFNLTQRLNEIIKLYNYTGQITISTNYKGAENVIVFADKEQFARAILNLIKNAIQAIPENRKGKIDLKVNKSNGKAIITITDNGKGIPDELKDHIFMPNFTTKSSGTGLGLAITKNIIESFKGKIWFNSQPDVGSNFYISLPITNQ